MPQHMGPALPDIASATLPATYERAKDALDVCQRVDECKDWADKAAALASYAKQADDQTLHKLATRIQVRAVRRAGELLRTFKSVGGRPRETPVATHESSSQRKVAAAAGLSEHQELQAVRVASVPKEDFEAAVESDMPPTVTTLAARGTVKQPTASTPWVADATRVIGLLRALAAFCEDHAADEVVQGVFPHERPTLRGHIGVIGVWVESFMAVMEERDHAEQIHRGPGADGDQRDSRLPPRPGK